MGNFISFGGGDKVKMNAFEFMVYSFVPLGTIFMRIFKLGGSLNEWFWLLPPFWTPLFGWMPSLAAQWGWIKKINNVSGSPIDGFILIPLIIKVLLPFLINISNFGELLINASIIILSLILMNLLHTDISYNCGKNENTDSMAVLKKGWYDALLQYSGATLTTTLVPEIIMLIPGLEEFDAVFAMPVIGSLVTNAIWATGLIAMYPLLNMYDINTESSALCDPKSMWLRSVISILGFLCAFAWNFKSLYI